MPTIIRYKKIPPKVNVQGWEPVRQYIENYLQAFFNNPQIVLGDDANIWEDNNPGTIVGSAKVGETTWSCTILDEFEPKLHHHKEL
jgi:hypothetical protein